MPTDSLSIIYSAKRGMRMLVNNGINDLNNPLSGTSSTKIIEAMKDLLLEVNWELRECTKAFGWILNVFNVVPVRGTPSMPLTPRDCNGQYYSILDIHFVFYDPGNQFPDPSPSCPGLTVFVMEGFNNRESLENMAAAITASTPYEAHYVLNSGLEGHENTDGILLTAKICGPIYNLSRIDFNPEINLVTSIDGGGYVLRSQAPASIYDVAIYGTGESVEQTDESVGFRFYMPPADLVPIGSVVAPGTTLEYVYRTALYQFPPSSTVIYMIANPHQFVIFDDTNDITNGVSLFACAPFIPAELGLLDYATFVIGGGVNSVRNTNNWNPHTTSIAINCPVIDFTAGGFSGQIELLCLRSPTNPMTTPIGKPLVETSYVLVTTNHPSIHEGVFGQIYDCAMYHDFLFTNTVMQVITVNGKKFLAIGGRDGASLFTRSTFVMAFE